MQRIPMISLGGLGLLAIVLVGCASTGAPANSDAGQPEIVISKDSPWAGLGAAQAVDRFLVLSVPYDMSKTHLVDSLAAAYGSSLVPALTAQLAALPPGAEAELPRFLLVRVGCRWAYRVRENGSQVPLTDALRSDRNTLLVRLGDAIDEVETTRYRSWLRNIEADRRCLEAIETLEARDSASNQTLAHR